MTLLQDGPLAYVGDVGGDSAITAPMRVVWSCRDGFICLAFSVDGAFTAVAGQPVWLGSVASPALDLGTLSETTRRTVGSPCGVVEVCDGAYVVVKYASVEGMAIRTVRIEVKHESRVTWTGDIQVSMSGDDSAWSALKRSLQLPIAVCGIIPGREIAMELRDDSGAVILTNEFRVAAGSMAIGAVSSRVTNTLTRAFAETASARLCLVLSVLR
ncbi:MAG TPA: hypothetical protein VF128_09820 [Gemmatimonadaceae bacterium]